MTPKLSISRSTGSALALALLALASCSSGRSGTIPYDPAGFRAPDVADAGLPATREYRLGPTDVVAVQVYRAPELSGDLRVDETGSIVMPLIGQVAAVGRTPAELGRAIADRLSERFYRNPDVLVTIKETAGQRITIDGSVASPGVYPIAGPTTLMQAVALAKGADENANLRKVVIFRTIGGKRMAAAFDLQSIREARMQDPQVYGSDIIIVDGNRGRQKFRDLLMSIPILGLFRPIF